MVLLTINPQLIKAIEKCKDQNARVMSDFNHPTEAPSPSLENPEVGQPISHGQIIAISKSLRHGKDTEASRCFHLTELLRGTQVYKKPPPSKPQQTEEYKMLMARLRKEAEQRSYDAMAVQPGSIYAGPLSRAAADPAETFEDEMTFSDVNRQLTLVVNVIVSIVFCAAAIWFTAWHWSTPRRLFASMGGGLVVGVAEVVIYAGYIRRLSEARYKERNKKEVKSITETWVIEGSKNSVTLPPTKQIRQQQQHLQQQQIRQRKGKV